MRNLRKLLSKVEDIFSTISVWAFMIGFTCVSLGVALWSAQWVLRLLGVM